MTPTKAEANDKQWPREFVKRQRITLTAHGIADGLSVSAAKARAKAHIRR